MLKGFLVGLVVGVGAAFLLTVFPRIVSGDFYEALDAVVALGVPVALLFAGTGALLGHARSHRS